MGCDIHVYVENFVNGEWVPYKMEPPPFDWRSYRMYGFLADVRNYSEVPPISEARGLPSDITRESKECMDYWIGFFDHSHSYLTVKELMEFDYSKVFEDRRISVRVRLPSGASFIDGAALAEKGHGMQTTYKDFLGEEFFVDLERLSREIPDGRIVFCFDDN